MENEDLATQMLARVRNHMLTSFGGIVLAVVAMASIAGLGRVIFGAAMPGWWGLIAFMMIALIPAIGFWSTFKNLRCPACNGVVAFQVSNHASLFGRYASNACRHCGKTIFDDRLFRRFRMMGVVAFVGAILMFGSAAFLGAR